MNHRVAVLHGVNLDTLGRRDPAVYGTLTLAELEGQVGRFAREFGFEASFFQTNHEGEYCEQLHRAAERSDAVVLNPGAWAHYSYAIRDALEILDVPIVEVHLSNVDEREEWRRRSVIADVVTERIAGYGAEGYRMALELIAGKVPA